LYVVGDVVNTYVSEMFLPQTSTRIHVSTASQHLENSLIQKKLMLKYKCM